MNKKHTLQLIIILFSFKALFAQDLSGEIDENKLFDDTVTVVDSKVYTDSSGHNENENKRVSLSGKITGSVGEFWSRQWFSSKNREDTDFQGIILGNFNGDIRLPYSAKSFIATEISYGAPQIISAEYDTLPDTFNISLKELFLDWNIKHHAYFRFGKQILQWGRGYFFNPVDLVNIEKTRLLNTLTAREGAFGIKMHIPVKTIFNFYSFLDMGNVRKIDNLALSLKTEFLVKATEFAFSVWLKNKADPVYGFDFSTMIGSFSLFGELALHHSVDTFSINWSDTLEFSSGTIYGAPRMSLGIGRFFDFRDIKDKILLNIEFYYNRPGKTNPDITYYFPEELDKDIIEEILDTLFNQLSNIKTNQLFDMSKWYSSAFLMINHFIFTDLTYNASLLYNLNHRCAIISSSLNYTTQHSLSFSLIVNSFIGKDNTEYTLFDSGMSLEGRVGISF